MPTEAPPAPPTAAPSTPPPTAPSTSPPIQVTPAAIDKGPQSPPPPKGSARERLSQDLRKKAGMDEASPPPDTAPRPGDDDETPPPEVQPDTPPTTPPTNQPKGKVSPWKLVDEHKAARLRAETELAELRKSMVDPAKFKEVETKAEAAERRAKELDDQMKFVDYSKSSEFQEKYQKPYEASWDRWMGELGELTVPNGDGNDRPIEPKDILALVNMPLQKAREQAESVFGSFANDVMDARKEIRGLFESQQKALADARTGGAERIAAMQKEAQQKQQAASKEIGDMWTQFNEAAVADEKFGKLLRPIDGDEEGNKRLKVGYEIADKAFAANPMDPRLTPEQRKEVVRLHSAVRHRAAAFGRAVYQLEKANAENTALKAELAKFKGAEPGKGEGVREKPEGGGTARDSVFGALRKIAGQ